MEAPMHPAPTMTTGARSRLPSLMPPPRSSGRLPAPPGAERDAVYARAARRRSRAIDRRFHCGPRCPTRREGDDGPTAAASIDGRHLAAASLRAAEALSGELRLALVGLSLDQILQRVRRRARHLELLLTQLQLVEGRRHLVALRIPRLDLAVLGLGAV